MNKIFKAHLMLLPLSRTVDIGMLFFSNFFQKNWAALPNKQMGLINYIASNYSNYALSFLTLQNLYDKPKNEINARHLAIHW